MIRKSVFAISSIVFCLLQANPSVAEHAWRHKVRGLQGEYTNVSNMGELLVFPIDLRKTFSSISSVSILVKGTAYPGRPIGLLTSRSEPGCSSTQPEAEKDVGLSFPSRSTQ